MWDVVKHSVIHIVCKGRYFSAATPYTFRPLGHGAFGEVCEGTMGSPSSSTPEVRIAVKVCVFLVCCVLFWYIFLLNMIDQQLVEHHDS